MSLCQNFRAGDRIGEKSHRNFCIKGDTFSRFAPHGPDTTMLRYMISAYVVLRWVNNTAKFLDQFIHTGV